MVFYFGSHVSISDGLMNAAESIKKHGGNLLQIFVTSPKQRIVSQKSKPELNKFINYTQKNNIKIVIHSSYLLNIAKQWDTHSWWLKNLELEIEYAHKIKAIGVVIHLGKQLDLTLNEAYNNMFTAILYVLNKTAEYKNVKLLIETSAGQGTELCYKLDDLAYFYNKFTNTEIINRLGICLDTCHIFAAGHDISSIGKINSYLKKFDQLIGIKNIVLIHLNDSKCDVGCRVDRHENIGDGYIGLENLKFIFKYFRKLNKFVILETPNSGYKKEIKLLLNS